LAGKGLLWAKKRQITVLFILMGMLSLKHRDNYSIFFVGGDVSAEEMPKFGVCTVRKILANWAESRYKQKGEFGKIFF